MWDHYFDGGAESFGICAGIKDNALIFRGSITATDWLDDLDAIGSNPMDCPQLGMVHDGFDRGMNEFFQKNSGLLRDGAIIGGHSLGAARAWLFAGRYIAKGGTLRRVTVFGSPRPGCSELKQLLANTPKSSYRNGDDPVPCVPVWLPSLPYVHVIEPTSVCAEPMDWTEGPMAWHNIGLYQEAVS
jgi:hypothetical protein